MNCECDCPICLDAIIGTTNKTTTECGHHFHTKCLMQNAIHNGFGCPLCRAKMAEEREEEEDEDDYSYDSDDYASSDDEDSWDDLIDEDYVLRGFRLMFRQNNVIETDEEYERVKHFGIPFAGDVKNRTQSPTEKSTRKHKKDD